MAASENFEQQQLDSTEERETILIVEDNADVVHYLVLCLQNHFHIQIAMNGLEGINLAIETIPDLIISDVMMPEKDGLELCSSLKENEITSHIPIILLTAKADVESKLAGLRRGADAYLPKPFHKEELLIRIEQLILNRKNMELRYKSLTILDEAEDEQPEEDAFLIKVRDIVLFNLEDEFLDANQLSQLMGFSRSQLHRKLKAVCGLSAMELVRNIRLEKSKELLRNAELNISEIAYSTGFKYPQTFTRAFQESYGVSPSKWRENL